MTLIQPDRKVLATREGDPIMVHLFGDSVGICWPMKEIESIERDEKGREIVTTEYEMQYDSWTKKPWAYLDFIYLEEYEDDSVRIIDKYSPVEGGINDPQLCRDLAAALVPAADYLQAALAGEVTP